MGGFSEQINQELGLVGSRVPVSVQGGREDKRLAILKNELANEKNPDNIRNINIEIAHTAASKSPAAPASIGSQVTAELMGNAATRQEARTPATPAVVGTTPQSAPQTAQTAPESTQTATPWADAFRNDPKGKGLPEAAAAIGSGIVSTAAAGLHGLYKLATTGSADEAAQAVRSTQEAGTYQPKTASGKAAMEVVGSNWNPLNWIPNAAKAGAEKGFEKGILDPSDAAAIEAVSTVLSPGALLKGGALFKRGAKPAAGETSPFGSAGSAAATNTATVKAAAERASTPELKQVISKTDPANVNRKGLERQLEADSLPVPIKLTAGQATEHLKTLSDEMNKRGEGKALIADRLNEQNRQLHENINEIRDKAAPDVFGTDHVENGRAIIDAYKATDEAIRTDIRAKYKALEDANGGKFPVDGVAFADAAAEKLGQKLKTDYVPKEVATQLARFKAGEPMNFEQFEALRTNLAEDIRSSTNGNVRYAAGIILDALESIPLTGESAALKPMADAARAAAKARFDLIRRDPAYKAVVDNKVAPDDFINRFVVNGKADKVKIMAEHLGEGSTAHQTMAAGLINHLKMKAGITNDAGTFNQSGYNKALQAVSPKLRDIVNPETATQLETLGNVARYTQHQPKGSWVNNSNTFVAGVANATATLAENAANTVLPYAQAGSRIRNWMGNRSELKSVENSLKVGAGISLKDIKDLK